jgi:hypothetical protein
VRSGLLRDPCSLGTRVFHGVYAGVCFPSDASSHRRLGPPFGLSPGEHEPLCIHEVTGPDPAVPRSAVCPASVESCHFVDHGGLSLCSFRLAQETLHWGGWSWWPSTSSRLVSAPKSAASSLTGFVSDPSACCIAMLRTYNGRVSTAASFSSALVGARR